MTASGSNFSGQDLRSFGKASAAGGLGAGLAGLLFQGDNPYEQASPYFNQIPGAASHYFNPYIQAGQGALGQLQGQFGQQTNDPGALLSRISSGYKQSPGYQWQLNQGLNAATNAAAAGGMAGSPQHQQQAATLSEGLANQDYYNYLQQVLGLYGMGNQGLQNINQMGYGAAGQQAGVETGNLANQGALAYSGQADQNAAQQSMWGDVFGSLGKLAFL